MRRIAGLTLFSLIPLLTVMPLAAQGFGTAIAAGDGEVFLSEPLNPYAKGAVIIYRPDGGRWREAARLNAADGSNLDRFGRVLSWSGNRLLIGATSIDSSRGAAYVFEKDGSGTWKQVAKLVPASAQAGESWGRQVLLQGDVAYVAAWGYLEGQGGLAIFRRGADGRWTEEAILTASDPVPNAFFGSGPSVEADLLLVGSVQRDTGTGAAYVFRRGADGRWSEEARLRGTGVARGSGFGVANLLVNGQALSAAPGLDRGMGAVFVYERDPQGQWQEKAKITVPDASTQSQFGSTLERVGDEVWVGAPGAERRQGRIYRLTRDAAGSWTIAGTLERSGLDRGDAFGGAVAVRGDIGAVGLPGDDYNSGTAVFLTRGPNGWTLSDKVWPETRGLNAITGGKRVCETGKIEVFDCSNVDLLAFLPISAIGGSRGVRLNDIWGWTDPQSGREYALVGRMDGTSFVDVTDPANPVFLGDLPLTDSAQANSWRDIKVYQDHAFIVADGAGPHGMQVFDLTRLRAVRNPPARFTPDGHYTRINSAHNIVIDTASGFAFSVGSSMGGETCGGALHMIDIRDPKNPTFAGCFADPATGRQRTGYTHDAQCVVYQGPDAEYRGRQICFNSSETAIGIADVTDKSNPRAISHAAYPNVAYTHQGWLTDDHRYFYVDDEGDEGSGLVSGTRTLIWDLADLDEPVLAGEYISQNPSTDHNLYVVGNTMYQSNYQSGLRVFDISDPKNPRPIGYFDTVPGPDTSNMDGSWSNYPFFKSGTVVVTSMGEGLFIVKKSDRTLIP